MTNETSEGRVQDFLSFFMVLMASGHEMFVAIRKYWKLMSSHPLVPPNSQCPYLICPGALWCPLLPPAAHWCSLVPPGAPWFNLDSKHDMDGQIDAERAKAG